MRAWCHRVTEVEGPGHDPIDECCILRRDPAPMDEDRRLLFSPMLSVQLNGRLTALGSGTRDRRPENRKNLMLHRLQGGGRYVPHPRLMDESSQLLLGLHQESPRLSSTPSIVSRITL